MVTPFTFFCMFNFRQNYNLSPLSYFCILDYSLSFFYNLSPLTLKIYTVFIFSIIQFKNVDMSVMRVIQML